jgi:hypothetical protein
MISNMSEEYKDIAREKREWPVLPHKMQPAIPPAPAVRVFT